MKIFDKKPGNAQSDATIEEGATHTPLDAAQANSESAGAPKNAAATIDKETSTNENILIVDIPSEEVREDHLVESIGNAEEVEDAEETQDAEEAIEVPADSRAWPPSREQILTWLAFGSVILLAAILRFWGLGDRPLHHDESLHAYFSIQLVNTIANWASCLNNTSGLCYRYDPLLHGPFQFHAIGLVYTLSKWLGAPDNGINSTTVRIAAATLGTGIVALPYFLRDRLGNVGAWLACLLLALAPSMVYYSRFAREDIYMAFFTILLVVGVGRYLSTRKPRWLMIAALSFSLSYATKEATFLTIGVFGSFLGAAILWEIGKRWLFRERFKPESRYLPRTWAPVLVLLYFVVLAPIAKVFFGVVNSLSLYITDDKTKNIALAYETGLKERTVALIPFIGILVGVWVLIILIREIRGVTPNGALHRLIARVDPRQQPLLGSIVRTPWYNWFFAGLTAWIVFLLLFSVLFNDLHQGIGSGIWEGLYYWLQQIPEARGGQPWYYYLLLIPMYEQLGLIFGIAGVVRSLMRPTPFRLFLVYWFVGNFFIYSWAAEKMPWLMIHITMPMLLLAAIALEPAIQVLINAVKSWFGRPTQTTAVALQTVSEQSEPRLIRRPQPKVLAGAALTTLLALILLIPTLYNTYQVGYADASNTPHEMISYVQTTPYVYTVMAKLDQLDKQYYGGHHQIPIGVTDGASWPFRWYLRDYTNICWSFPQSCPDDANSHKYLVIIAADNDPGDTLGPDGPIQKQFGSTYKLQEYPMRWWWDEGYKRPPVCTGTDAKCVEPDKTCCGVGPLLWLSYGDNPPPNAHFDLSRAAQNLWTWLWTRKAIGSSSGPFTNMDLLIRNDLPVNP